MERAERNSERPLAYGSVLLVDEAGMVNSAGLARLIHHAQESSAKLVLVGDPEQLGEIEAGGLFRALAERTDPIHLDEVIRHEHELDREAARLIREGEGAEALDLYRSEERVVVAPDAQARREAMVAEWHESFAAGEDAVMVAKQNVEVERLNAMARQVRQEAGQLGGEEIEVGEAGFAAGDQIITRVNDRSADIFNRERWQVAEVDAEKRRVVLEGVDQARRVEVGADYLARANPHSGASAFQHAYAVTTYSAQGTTVDRAFVAADPSMDKQELYVAASRSRGETTIYATPEVGIEREEIAPDDPYLRGGLSHLAEASERDGAQRAAHDIALRDELRKLPTEELISRHDGLRSDARAEAGADERHRSARSALDSAEQRLQEATAECRALEALPGPERAQQAERIEFLLAVESAAREVREHRLEELRESPPAPGQDARVELRVAEQVVVERHRLAVTAAQLSPPDYIVRELGERPDDPQMRKVWDRGVEGIESYRQENGIKDRGNALGKEPSGGIEWSGWRDQRSRLAEQQRTLQLQQARSLEHDLGHELDMGM